MRRRPTPTLFEVSTILGIANDNLRDLVTDEDRDIALPESLVRQRFLRAIQVLEKNHPKGTEIASIILTRDPK